MYVRCICHPTDWEVDDIEKLPNLAISDWSSIEDSDFSMFKIDSLENQTMLNHIAIYFFSQNPKKHNDFSLLPVFDEFALTLPHIEEDSFLKFGTLHVNVKNATFKDFKSCVAYTYGHRRDLIPYDISKFQSVFDINDEEMWKMLTVLKNEKSEQKNLLKSIRSTYFRDKDKFEKLYESW